MMYGCETWSSTLTEEYRPKVFENRVPRKRFEPKRDEVTGDLSLNDQFHDLYSSPNFIRVIREESDERGM